MRGAGHCRLALTAEQQTFTTRPRLPASQHKANPAPWFNELTFALVSSLGMIDERANGKDTLKCVYFEIEVYQVLCLPVSP